MSIKLLKFLIPHRKPIRLFIGLLVTGFVFGILEFGIIREFRILNIIEWNRVKDKPIEQERGCHLPNLNAIDLDTINFPEKPVLDCTNEDYPILFESDLDSNIIASEGYIEFSLKKCCYQDMYQVQNTKRGNNCVPITQSVTRIPPELEYIGVFCENGILEADKINMNRDYRLYDIFGFARIKPEVENRVKKITSPGEKLSIIVFGVDATSHVRFITLMAKMRYYLSEEFSASGMNGYTKVGAYTYPNIVPVLTGHHVAELEAKFGDVKTTEQDDWPYIWKNFSARGFRTSYLEDGPWLTPFAYAKRGFKKYPTDYFTPRMMHTPMKSISHQDLGLIWYHLCCGPRSSLTSLLDNVKQLATIMASDGEIRKYFQLVWASTMTHDYSEYTYIADDEILSTLMFLNEKGFLNHTAFVIMSDHGHEWNSQELQHEAQLERNMPFLYFAFPEWFRDKYRNAIINMNNNRERLTTPFDLHETLVDLISPQESISDAQISIRQEKLNGDGEKPRGISLFLEIPKERTCKMAGIPKTFCMCHFSKPIAKNLTATKSAADCIVKELNHKLEDYTQCAKLKLSAIIGAEVREEVYNQTNTENYLETLFLTLEVSPSKGHFEATVTKNSENGLWNVDEIVRINMYGNQSHCVTNSLLKPYCYC